MSKWIKKSVKNLADSFGYTVLPNWQVADLALDLLLKRLLNQYGITMVIDVGANAGQYRNRIRNSVEFSGLIHSFEPLPHLATQLTALGKDDSQWHIHNLALGNENTTLPLNVMFSEVFSSFRQPDATETKSFVNNNTVVRTEIVPVRRLDDLASSLEGIDDGAILLKIDTQGFDLDVILGAKELISKVSILQFELALLPIYKDVPHHLEILNIVQELGFEISGYFPISHDEHLRAIELDCIMVRRPTLL